MKNIIKSNIFKIQKNNPNKFNLNKFNSIKFNPNKFNPNKFNIRRFYSCNKSDDQLTKGEVFFVGSVLCASLAGTVIGGIWQGYNTYCGYMRNEEHIIALLFNPVVGMAIGCIGGGIIGVVWPILVVGGAFSLVGMGIYSAINGLPFSLKIKKKNKDKKR